MTDPDPAAKRPRPAQEPHFKKILVRIYAEDHARGIRLYPNAGYNRIIRELWHRHLNAVEAKQKESSNE